MTKDHLISIRELTDNSGTFLAQFEYSPYGEAVRVTGTSNSDRLYAAYYIHQRSSLNVTEFRFYSSKLAGWISRDPVEEADFPNLYSYCVNNPENLVDPTGLYCCRIDWDDVKKAVVSGSAWGAGAGAAGGALSGAGAGTLVVPDGGTIVGAEGGAAIGALGLGAVGGFAAGGANLAGQLINNMGTREGSGSNLRAQGGPPNGTLVHDEGGGKGVIRDYDGDGKAKTDYDFGHDHKGAGDPHAHDWDWNKPGKKKRCNPRPLRAGE